MNKHKVRDDLVKLVAAEIKVAKAAYDEHMEASKPDGYGTVVPDEQAQNWTQAGLAASLEEPVRAAEAKLATLQRIDFGPKDKVEPGAIVTVNGSRYVIGVSIDRFASQGVELTGVSLAAPFCRAIQGLEKSDTAEFLDRTLTIDDII